jgi:hypothetical protein
MMETSPFPDDAPINPYAPPVSDPRASEPFRSDPCGGLIQTCVILNLVLATACAGVLLVLASALIYSRFFEEPRHLEFFFDGLIYTMILGLPFLVGLAIYAPAASGLLHRRSWSYRYHIGGAIFAGLTVVGLVYTAVAVILATRPGFRESLSE